MTNDTLNLEPEIDERVFYVLQSGLHHKCSIEEVRRLSKAVTEIQNREIPGNFKCLYKNSGGGGNDPQDCDWPVCGCDPYADKVIAALEEGGIQTSVKVDSGKPKVRFDAPFPKRECSEIPVNGDMPCPECNGGGAITSPALAVDCPECGGRGTKREPKREISGVPIPSEAMCDNARGFIMGLDLNIRTWGAMKKHLSMGGYLSCPRIDTQAEVDPKGHITKWDVAECIYILMNTKTEIEDGA